MAERAADGSLYGQFGQATYDQAKKQWLFERETDTPYLLQPLGESKLEISPTAIHVEPILEAEDQNGAGRRREKQAKALAKSHPELQPALGLLPDLARLSEAVEKASNRHDPVMGNLIAYGTITDQHARHTAEVVAFPTGPAGSDLCITQIRPEQRGWHDSKEFWLEVPTIQGESATWRGPGVPIQSIVFAQSTVRSAMILAVRLPTETIIFRPVLRKEMFQNTSRLDVNLLFRLGINDTDSPSHADVALNPWYSRQFAVVDQRGTWSVREWEGRQPGTARVIFKSSLFDDAKVQSERPLDDGWARILWVGTPNIVAICIRRKLQLYDFESHRSEDLLMANVALDDGLGWYLDLACVSSRPNYLLALTSSHLVLHHVAQAIEEPPSSTVALCVRHFRNAGDISLRLYVLAEDEAILLFIKSDMNPIVTSYHLAISDSDQIAISNPAEVPLNPSKVAQPSSTRLSSIYVCSLPLKRKADNLLDNSLAAQYAARGVQFYVLIALCKDLSMQQILLSTALRASEQIVPPSWKQDYKEKPSRSAARYDDNDFVVNDDCLEPELPRVEPVSNHVQRRKAHETAALGNEWTVEFTLTARSLNDVDVNDVTELNEVLEEARETLRQGYPAGDPPMRTLKELNAGEIAVRDFEEAAQSLHALQLIEASVKENPPGEDEDERTVEPSNLVLRARAFALDGRELVQESFDRLDTIYESIVDRWISPLSGDMPEMTRSRKEQLAGRVAAEVVLASHVLCLEKYPTQQPLDSQDQSQTWQLPVRTSDLPASTRATPSIYFDASSQPPESPAFPTRSPSVAPSAFTGSSRLSTVAAPEIARLSQYTTFSKPPPPTLLRSLSRVLSHWTPGSNPAAYDWQATSRRSAREDEEIDSQELTEKERLRNQRRAERHLRRQRREAEDSQRQRVLSSQAPEIFSASQPSQYVGAESQATGVGISQMATASQVVPGRHASRRPARKKRKSGF